VAPAEYIGAIMKLGQERRGVYQGMHYVDPTRGRVQLGIPTGRDHPRFLRQLKTISRGYACSTTSSSSTARRLVKLDMLLNGEAVDAFSVIIHRDKAYEWGKKIAEKLREPDPAPAVRGGDPSRDRHQGDRPRERSARCART